jgi:DNA invertase Pin-like site-specific DNA recombinase
MDSKSVSVEPAQLRVVTYARYSSDGQRASSIVDQERNCARRAEAEGWTVVARYADAAISGSDNRRPQYLAMQQAAARREFDLLLVDDLSRLTRDSVEQETVVRRLEFQGIRIIAVADGYDSVSKSRKIQRGFKGLMNEMFLDDLRAKVHRGLEGQAIKQRWCGGRPYGYRLKPILDPSCLDAYGQPARIGSTLVVDSEQAKVVTEIFESYASGMSTTRIAAALNERGVPSAGSSWKRTVRRAAGWMSSSVRAILKNPLYVGRLEWNTSAFVKDPDTGKRVRRKRPRAEWVVHQVAELCIVPAALFERVQARLKTVSNDDPRLKLGGKASKYLLSGLGVCGLCGSSFVVADARGYGCSGFLHGRACKNNLRAPRDSARLTLEPVLRHLRDPKMVAEMVKFMEAEYAQQMRDAAPAVPATEQMAALDARIAKLRGRLAAGDPDLTRDDLQAAIERAEASRESLKAAAPAAKQQARVLALLPKAAAAYLRQIEAALDGADPRRIVAGRLILRDLIGKIAYTPEPDGSLWASYRLNPGILVSGAHTRNRFCGSGGVLPHLIATLPRCPKAHERGAKSSKQWASERRASFRGATRRMAW